MEGYSLDEAFPNLDFKYKKFLRTGMHPDIEKDTRTTPDTEKEPT